MILHGGACAAQRVLLLLSLGALAGCAKGAGATTPSGNAPGASPTEAPRLAMVAAAPGTVAYGEAAYAGLLKAKAHLGADVQVMEPKTPGDYRPDLTMLADEDYDDVFAAGADMRRDLASVARLYPKRHFAIVGSVVDEPNVTSLTFKNQEGSFLAGALAALVSKTRTVAFLGGMESPALERFEAGFRAGVRQIDPRVRVIVSYAGTTDDAAAVKRAAASAYDAGADIAYVAAGAPSTGAFEEARSRPKAYIIGVDVPSDSLAPGKVLTSVIRRADVAVFATAQDARSQKLPAGEVAFGLENDGIVLARFDRTAALVGTRNVARLGALRRAIVAGTLVPPATRATLASFRPTAGV